MDAYTPATEHDALEEVLSFARPLKGVQEPRWKRKQRERAEAADAAATTAAGSGSAAPTPSKKAKQPAAAVAGSSVPSSPSAGDRFIPTRSGMDADVSRSNMDKASPSAAAASDDDSDAAAGSDAGSSSSSGEYKAALAAHLDGKQQASKVLAFKNKPPPAPEGWINDLRVMYSQDPGHRERATGGAARRPTRHIPSAPERVLDAPDIVDDFYLQLLDWGSNNCLAIALQRSVFVWDAGSGAIHEVCALPEESDNLPTSVRWSQDGNCLAIGMANAEIQLWDVARSKRLRSLRGHSGRVGVMDWNNWMLSSGSGDRSVINWDVRVAAPVVSRLDGHADEVCGLRWSPDGRTLASGSNDNTVCLWRGAQPQDEPAHRLTAHMAAVKAMAWCPWQPTTLATGGGTADKTIKFWNADTGAMLNSTDAGSQVTALSWSAHHRELVSAHGYARNEIKIWSYPTMTPVHELVGHTSRVLGMSVSPDGTTICSVAGDETLRFWRALEPTIEANAVINGAGAAAKKAGSAGAAAGGAAANRGRVANISIR